MTRAGVVVLVTLFTLGGALVFAAHERVDRSVHRSRCGNNLRQLGLAALQHAEDRDAFPHFVEGGVESNQATRAARSLVWLGYHDTPEGFVCPSSNDEAAPRTVANATWTWASDRDRPLVSPLKDDAPDPTLASTTELSYAWTRRRLPRNARGSAPLAADRAVRHEAFREAGVASDDVLQGNHVDGLNVVTADATVSWTSTIGPVDAEALGTIGMVDPLRPRPPTLRPAWRRLGADGLALVPLGLAGAVCLLSAAPAARPAARTRRRPGRIEAVPALAAASLLQPQQRCPFCHDDVTDAHALTRCEDCHAVFHAECVALDAACTTLGCRAAARV